MLPPLFQSTVTVPTRSIPINQTKSKPKPNQAKSKLNQAKSKLNQPKPKLNQANADAGNWIWMYRRRCAFSPSQLSPFSESITKPNPTWNLLKKCPQTAQKLRSKFFNALSVGL